MAGDLLRQSILHAGVALLVTALLLAFWRVRCPTLRARLQLLALGPPVLASPLLVLLLPSRDGDLFQDRWALFTLERWRVLSVGGWRVDHVALGVCAAAGLVLYLRDLVPLLKALRARRVPLLSPDDALRGTLARLSGRLGISPPGCVVRDEPAPALRCEGFARPVVVLSRRALDLLDEQEREAALAHELAHLARHDLAIGWVLMLVRTLHLFNPALQLLARSAVHEAEGAADREASRLTGRPVALASGLLKLARGGGSGPEALPSAVPAPNGLVRITRRSQERALARRVEALLGDDPGAPTWPALRAALLLVAVIVLSVLVV